NMLAWGSSSAPNFVRRPLAGEGKGPAEDPVFILQNPWVHEQDEIVASLYLPSPPAPPFRGTKTIFDNESGYTLNEETRLNCHDDSPLARSATLINTIPFPAVASDVVNANTSMKSTNQPLYLFELIAFACMFKQAKPEYHVFTTNCFWYCAMILHLVRLRHGLKISRLKRPDSETFTGFVDLPKSPSHDTRSHPDGAIEGSTLESAWADDGSSSWKWESVSESDAKVSRVSSSTNLLGRQDRYTDACSFPCVSTFPLPQFSSCSTPPQGSSWYSSKMGTWYGIRVSRTPSGRVLKAWLVRAEEAVDRFMTKVCGSSHFLDFLDPFTLSSLAPAP
ncbi:hypothetical protein AN958_05627, partial [Leucoagaricus sp. SymC.cos]